MPVEKKVTLIPSGGLMFPATLPHTAVIMDLRSDYGSVPPSPPC